VITTAYSRKKMINYEKKKSLCVNCRELTWKCFIVEVGDKKEEAVIEFQHESNESLELPIVEEVFKQRSPLNVNQKMYTPKASHSNILQSTVDTALQNDIAMQDCDPSSNLVHDVEESERSQSPVIFYRSNVRILCCFLYFLVLAVQLPLDL